MIQIKQKGIEYPLHNYFAPLCEHYSAEPYPRSVYADPALRQFVYNFCAKVETYEPAWCDTPFVRPAPPVVSTKNKGVIIVAFSGGKDGLAVALKLLQAKKEVILYHLLGVNRTYGHEVFAAEKLAKRLGVQFVIDRVQITGKQTLPDHPFKNQLITCNMVDAGNTIGVTDYAMGDHVGMTLAEADVRWQFTDVPEQQQLFDNFVRQSVPAYSRKTYLKSNTQALEIIIAHDWTLLNDVSSCVTPQFRKPMMRQHIQRKYGDGVLLDGRCGYCIKCVKEWMTLVTHGKLKYNNGFWQHCTNVVRNKEHMIYD
jgi:hypothetical protein